MALWRVPCHPERSEAEPKDLYYNKDNISIEIPRGARDDKKGLWMTERAAKDDLVNLPQKQGSRKSQGAARDFWEEEYGKRACEHCPFGAMRERSRLLRRGKVFFAAFRRKKRMRGSGKCRAARLQVKAGTPLPAASLQNGNTVPNGGRS